MNLKIEGNLTLKSGRLEVDHLEVTGDVAIEKGATLVINSYAIGGGVDVNGGNIFQNNLKEPHLILEGPEEEIEIPDPETLLMWGKLKEYIKTLRKGKDFPIVLFIRHSGWGVIALKPAIDKLVEFGYISLNNKMNTFRRLK